MSFKLFFRTIMFSGVITIVTIVFLVFFIQEKTSKLEKIKKRKVQSLLLSYELRQSSDDLTRLARTYVVTKNNDYEKMYWDIIRIRNGDSPRPLNYNRIYWDFIIDYKNKPIDKGDKISLLELMGKTGFTTKEFKLLEEAKNNSDELIKLETIAMNAIKGLYINEEGKYEIEKEPNQEMAIKLLHSKKYHEEKAKIMKPINKFMQILETRTNQEVKNALDIVKTYANILIIVLIVITIFYIGLFYINRNKTKNLTLFKNELLEFFKYINNESEFKGTINIDEKGEIAEMLKVINSNIIKIKDNIDKDKKALSNFSEVLTSVNLGELSKRVTIESSNVQINVLKNLINDMLNMLQSVLGKDLNNILAVLDSFANSKFDKKVINPEGEIELVINQLGNTIDQLVTDVKFVINTVENGDFENRLSTQNLDGDIKDINSGLNTVISSI
ncbi:MAG: hypothetical protein GY932_14150, partial [Arcobacter sp.]|nr:hypothetical protein [Arcobacter sp.]